MMNVIKKHPIASYFTIAWISTWILVLPLILANFGLLSVNMNWHFLGALGPTISAIIVAYISAKKRGLKELGKTSFKWRVGPFWILFSALIMPFFLLLSILLNFLFTGNLINLIGYLVDNGISNPLSIFLWIWVGAISYGLFEEIGWRGYALPKLQEKYNPLIATIILTIGWAFWHFPMFLYHFSVDMLFGWLYSLFMGSIILTFLFNSSGGSAFVTILFHITNNLVWLFNIGELQIYLTIMITIFALIILIVWKIKLSVREESLKK